MKPQKTGIPIFNVHGVWLEKETHQYFDTEGNRYLSVSKLIELYSPAFEKDEISRRKAVSELTAEGRQLSQKNILQRQSEIQSLWKAKTDSAIDDGNRFHKAMEDLISTGRYTDPEWKELCQIIYGTYLAQFYRTYAEQIVADKDSRVAGTMDVPAIHSSKQKDLVHIRDFKSNKKGITNNEEYIKWMLPPFDYLPANKYTKYALQQSLYAAMLMKSGFRIGSISLIWVNVHEKKHREIFIPFMYEEAKKLLQLAKTIQL